MTVRELIDALEEFYGAAEVVLEDVNGLHWKMEPSLVRLDGGRVVIGAKDLNRS